MRPETFKKKILIVEDDQYILESLSELLEEEGYSVAKAINGQEALDYLRSTPELPDLILLDLMMPIKDGIQFRSEQEMDQRLSSIPIVLMSADAQLESKKYKMGLKYHLKKPLDVDTLVNTVKQFCA